MSRLPISLLSLIALLAACAPTLLSQRELVGGVLLVGYQAQAGALIEALAVGGINVQPGDGFGFLNLRSRSSTTVVLSARRLGGVGQAGDAALVNEIGIEATVRQAGERAEVTLRGEPILSGAVAEARRGLVELLDARFPRADLDPLDGDGMY